MNPPDCKQVSESPFPELTDLFIQFFHVMFPLPGHLGHGYTGAKAWFQYITRSISQPINPNRFKELNNVKVRYFEFSYGLVINAVARCCTVLPYTQPRLQRRTFVVGTEQNKRSMVFHTRTSGLPNGVPIPLTQ